MVLLVRVPFGLKSNVALHWEHMTATVCGEGFICNEDPDMWMRPRLKPNGDVLKVYPKAV